MKNKIIISGNCTIESINKVKKLFNKSLEGVKEIIIEHTNLEEMDLTYYQLLHSFVISAGKNNTSVIIQDSPSGIINYFCSRFELKNLVN